MKKAWEFVPTPKNSVETPFPRVRAPLHPCIYHMKPDYYSCFSVLMDKYLKSSNLRQLAFGSSVRLVTVMDSLL